MIKNEADKSVFENFFLMSLTKLCKIYLPLCVTNKHCKEELCENQNLVSPAELRVFGIVNKCEQSVGSVEQPNLSECAV